MSIQKLSGVGPRMMERLEALEIYTLQDLLLHLPIRYEDRTQITPIKKAHPGKTVLVQGKVLHAAIIQKGRRVLRCVMQDETGVLELSFFHFYAMQLKQMQAANSVIRCYGEVQFGKNGFQMIHPEWQIFKTDTAPPVDTHLTPIYSTTEGVYQNFLRKLIKQAFEKVSSEVIPELLPEAIRREYGFPPLLEALRVLHFPKKEEESAIQNRTHPALRYGIFTELLAHQLSLAELRKKMETHSAPALSEKNKLVQRLIASLPFDLTNAQKRVVGEVQSDLMRSIPMQRLVLGDVGSGKTVIAAAAIAQAVDNHYQAALMVPTTLLAEQHTKNFTRWFMPLGVEVVCLKSGLGAKAETAILQAIASGTAHIIIGTHALFQEHVQFKKLGLMVIDEQHRFGVEQRIALKNKKAGNIFPHQLIMTATPIPRTLAIFSYADLDISFLDEKPVGRKPITTVLIDNAKRNAVMERVQANCAQGKQAYWVCPLIEESEQKPMQAAQTFARTLQKQCKVRVGLLHGRMKNEEKEKVMRAFLQKEIDLLVATTVIEVGVDVSNASLMIIENAERMGLAQLHQLRGRVGRGEEQSYCVLLYQGPLNALAQKRLVLLRDNQNGFQLAEADLTLRGPGEILGIRQSGAVALRIAQWEQDHVFFPEILKLRTSISHENSRVKSQLVTFWLNRKGNMLREH